MIGEIFQALSIHFTGNWPFYSTLKINSKLNTWEDSKNNKGGEQIFFIPAKKKKNCLYMCYIGIISLYWVGSLISWSHSTFSSTIWPLSNSFNLGTGPWTETLTYGKTCRHVWDGGKLQKLFWRRTALRELLIILSLHIQADTVYQKTREAKNIFLLANIAGIFSADILPNICSHLNHILET